MWRAPPQWWAVGLLALAQLFSFGLIASQHATIQQLRGQAPPAPLGRRLLQAQPATAATNSDGGLPSGLLAFEGGRVVIKAHVVIQPSQAAVDSYYGTGTFRAAQPALQIEQALLSGGSAGTRADAAAAPAIATQSPTQPISLQGPLTANTVTAGTLQTTAGGVLMSGGAVVAGTLQTTAGAAVLSGGSLTCSLVTADVLQTADALPPSNEPANGTAGGTQQQQQQARGVTISGGAVTATVVQGGTLTSAGALQGASLDVGSGSITGGSLSAQRITAPSGTVTCGTLLAQNAGISQRLTAAAVTIKGDAMFESDAEVQGVTTLGRKASTQPALNVLGTARTAVLQTTTATVAGQTSTKSLVVQTTTTSVGATTVGSLVVNQGVEVKGALSAQKCGCASLAQQLQSTPAGSR